VTHFARYAVRLWIVFVALTACAGTVLAQGVSGGQAQAGQPPAAKPDDTPSIRVGATLFADYTYTQSPESTDADGNTYHPSQFNVTRSYINLTGNISHLVAFRFTPDIVRQTDPASSLGTSLVFRVKYAYAQVNLDDWMSKGSWVRLGMQQTPWVDFFEGIYRYRFQGTTFTEREGYLSSSDAGAAFHYNLPSNYGEVHAGFYNGENYARSEVNGQKAFEVRGSVRPFATASPILQGLRVHGFYDADSYVKDGPRRRGVLSATFEHARLNLGADYLNTTDRTSVTKPEVDGHGYSFWATPRAKNGLEGLLRYDHMTPDTSLGSQIRTRTIVGVAYWFPHQGNVSSALMLDYDGQTFDNYNPALPKQQRIAVHGLVNF
jgi:hypothetical protein